MRWKNHSKIDTFRKKKDFNAKKPRHHVEAFEFLNVSAVCVFYVVMICIFENQFSFWLQKYAKN